MYSNLPSGLTCAKLHHINTLVLQWGEAAGPFLSIELLMRHIAEIHKPMREKVVGLLKTDKSTKNKKYIHYWDCDPKYLVDAIIAEFATALSSDIRVQILKYPDIRGKFLHANFIGLMEVMGGEPSSKLQIANGKWKELEPGEIYESLCSMKRNEAFEKVRRYASDVTQTLHEIIRSLTT